MCMIMRQNFAQSCEEKLNEQINMELKACHQYLAMVRGKRVGYRQIFEMILYMINCMQAYHFDRADVSCPGMYKFFLNASAEEREHAEKIMTYMNKRGGRIQLVAVPTPIGCYKDKLAALRHALAMEMEVNQHLLDLHALAGKENDPNLCDFIEANFLQEQVDGQKQLADFIKQLERAQSDVGNYLFDKYMLNASMHGASS